jgi:cytochrome c556
MVRKLKIAALTFVALGVAAAPLIAGTNRAPRTRPAITAPVRAPADVVKARQSGFKELGAAFKAVRDGTAASEMSMMVMQQSANKIKATAAALPNWFPAGSGASATVKSAAKPEIWSKPAEFRTAQANFATQANAFEAAVATGNADNVKAAFRALGGACKGCHDNFKAPEHDHH